MSQSIGVISLCNSQPLNVVLIRKILVKPLRTISINKELCVHASYFVWAPADIRSTLSASAYTHLTTNCQNNEQARLHSHAQYSHFGLIGGRAN